MKLVRITFLISACCALLVSSCSKSNNLMLGRVEAQVGAHTVIITDCYRTDVPSPKQLANTPEGNSVFRFFPCKDSDVLIEGKQLFVNGISYGELTESDTVIVDHGKVFINNIEASVKKAD